MTRAGLPRIRVQTAALQVGEFAVGVCLAYAAIAAAWSLSHTVWPLLVAAAVVVAVAIALEVRFGSKATGLVAGMLPTSLLVAGLLVALSLAAYRLN
jgi:hypothetical protein